MAKENLKKKTDLHMMETFYQINIMAKETLKRRTDLLMMEISYKINIMDLEMQSMRINPDTQEH
jgi:hypothetical protein